MKHILISILTISLLSFSVSADEGITRNMPVKVYVTGEVTTPKSLNIPPNIGLVAAVYAAGGPTNEGSMQRVTVLRKGKVTVLNRKKHPKEVFPLKSGDVILVPPRTVFGR